MKAMKKLAALMICFALSFALLPATAFAIDAEKNPSSYNYNQTPAEKVTVGVTISNDSLPLMGNDEDSTILSNKEITVPYFDLDLYDLRDYYRYETDEDGSYTGDMEEPIKRPTLLHLYIYLLERYYLGLPEDECCQGKLFEVGGNYEVKNMFGDTAYEGNMDALYITGTATSMYMQNFWGHDENLMYYRNHRYPLQRQGWGSTADYILLDNGDKVDLAMFTDWNFYTSGGFLCFNRDNYTVAAGNNVTLFPMMTDTSAVNGDDSFLRAFDQQPLVVGVFDEDWNEIGWYEPESSDPVSLEGFDGYGYPVTIGADLDPGTYHVVALDDLAGSTDAKFAPATATLKVVAGEHEHEYVKHDARAADCGHQGNKEYYSCNLCESLFSDQEGTVVEDPDSLFSPIVGEHEFAEWTVTIKPECTMDGQKKATCTKCGTAVFETAPAPGHDYGSPKFKWNGLESCTVDLTCGTHSYHQKLTNQKATVTSEITKPATCTEDGVRTYTAKLPAGQSKVSSTYFGFWEDCVDTKTEVIPATGVHDVVEVAEVPATCTKAGVAAGTKCSMCGEVFSGFDKIPAKGHSWSAPTYKWNDAKTVCTATRTCKGCKLTESEKAKTSVSFLEGQEPTCDMPGAKIITAKFKNKAFATQREATVAPKLNHKFGDWEVTKEATTAAAGSKQRTCELCGEVETASISKLSPVKGTILKTSSGTFKVTSVSKRTVTFVAPAKAKAKTVTVPNKVKVDGKTWKVAGIAAKAFKGTKATKVIVEAKNLKKSTVKSAFKGSKVKTVKVQKSKKSAYKKIFKKKIVGKKVKFK